MFIKFIFFVVFLGLISLLLGITFIFRVIRSIFGIPEPQKTRRRTSANTTGFHKKSADDSTKSSQRKKIFDHTDGEYVDFEDVKDNKE